MRRMYDSVTASDIPHNAELVKLVAGYVDGHYANIHEVRERFPHAQVLTITVTGNDEADIIDCEKGDATPDEAAAWCKWMSDKGHHPTVYCNASAWSEVQHVMHEHGQSPNYWIANEDGGDDTIPDGAAARQFLLSPGLSPGHYDVSNVHEWWHPAPVQQHHDAPETHAVAIAHELQDDITRLTNRLHAREHRLTHDDAERLARLADAVQHARGVK